MIVVNFKTYREATGFGAVKLARIAKAVSEETKVRIIVVPQLVDLAMCDEVGVECWAQHVDPIGQGKFTGFVSREAVEEAGAKGTLINHAEHKLGSEGVKKTMEVVGGYAFETCICAASLEEVLEVAAFNPDYIAYEPPELIGSTDKSVASEDPEIIQKIVQSAKCKVLIGAGIHSFEDVKTGLKLGAMGILLATDVVLAEDPEHELRKLTEAFKS